MKKTIYLLLCVTLMSCNSSQSQNIEKEFNAMPTKIKQIELTNSTVKEYTFLDCMYDDSYFPTFLVDKCKTIFLNLCFEIETKKPSNLEELYKLTHVSTNKLNGLQNEFYDNNSEIETGARECFVENFEFVANTYGFEADLEELIATREW
jgi:hypothetical protein